MELVGQPYVRTGGRKWQPQKRKYLALDLNLLTQQHEISKATFVGWESVIQWNYSGNAV